MSAVSTTDLLAQQEKVERVKDECGLEVGEDFSWGQTVDRKMQLKLHCCRDCERSAH